MDMTTTLLLALVCIAIGFMIGALVFSLRGAKAGTQTLGDKEGGPAKEAVRLLRDQHNESLIVELDGTIIKSATDLHPEQRQQLVLASTDLRTWLGIFPPEPKPTESIADPFLPSESASDTREEDRPDWLSKLESAPESERPSLNPFKIFTQPVQESDANLPTKSIAAQIDEILQEKLINTPLEDRGIRLIEKPGQGISVIVGFDNYDSVEAVPDESVQAVIREAVAEWEKGASM